MKDFFNKETLDNIKQFCAENKKYVGVAGVLVGLILILIVVVAGGNNGRQSNTEAGSQTEISVKDFEFEKDYTNDAKDDISTYLLIIIRHTWVMTLIPLASLRHL